MRTLKTITLAVIVVAVIASIVGFGFFRSVGSQQTVTCAVTGKDHTIAASSSGSSPVYRVYTDDCDVLSIEDNMFFGVYDSASIYGKIQPGHTYQFKTIGWRMPIFSMFPDIISATEVN